MKVNCVKCLWKFLNLFMKKKNLKNIIKCNVTASVDITCILTRKGGPTNQHLSREWFGQVKINRAENCLKLF